MSYLVQSLKNAPVSIAQSIADTAARDAAIAASAPSAHVGSGGAAHALATTSVAGFLGASDKVKLDAITGSNTGDETATSIKSKLGITTLSGTNTGDQTSVSGNAGTATKLETARTINGVAFDGSADIVVNAVDATARVASSEKGAAGGVAPLGLDGLMSIDYLPPAILGALSYRGTWDADTNTPTIPAAIAGNKGYFYKVSTDGSTDIGGISDWRIGDWIISSGSAWDKVDNTDSVSSVAGRTGAVVLTKSDVGLSDVDNTGDLDKPVSTAQAAADAAVYYAAVGASIPITQKGSADGVAELDSSEKVPAIQLPTDFLSKSDVGLGNVDNTSDINKPVSTAQAAADAAVQAAAAADATTKANARQAALVSGTNIKTINGNSLLGSGDLATGDVTLTGTQTLTNKTLTAPAVNGYTEGVSTANTSTAYTISIATASVQILTLTGNCTYTFPAAVAGKSFLLVQKQDATGSRTATWPAAVKWPSGTAPTLTAMANKSDVFGFTCDGTSWYGRVIGSAYA